MARFSPEYDRQIGACNWTTNASGTTAVDDTTAFPATTRALVHSMLVKTHSWDTAAAGASGCSGAYVQLVDDASHVVYETEEALTGTTTMISADVMLVGATTVRYRMCDGNKDTRVTSGAAAPWSWNNPDVYIYTY